MLPSDEQTAEHLKNIIANTIALAREVLLSSSAPSDDYDEDTAKQILDEIKQRWEQRLSSETGYVIGARTHSLFNLNTNESDSHQLDKHGQIIPGKRLLPIKRLQDSQINKRSPSLRVDGTMTSNVSGRNLRYDANDQMMGKDLYQIGVGGGWMDGTGFNQSIEPGPSVRQIGGDHPGVQGQHMGAGVISQVNLLEVGVQPGEDIYGVGIADVNAFALRDGLKQTVGQTSTGVLLSGTKGTGGKSRGMRDNSEENSSLESDNDSYSDGEETTEGSDSAYSSSSSDVEYEPRGKKIVQAKSIPSQGTGYGNWLNSRVLRDKTFATVQSGSSITIGNGSKVIRQVGQVGVASAVQGPDPAMRRGDMRLDGKNIEPKLEARYTRSSINQYDGENGQDQISEEDSDVLPYDSSQEEEDDEFDSYLGNGENGAAQGPKQRSDVEIFGKYVAFIPAKDNTPLSSCFIIVKTTKEDGTVDKKISMVSSLTITIRK